MSKEKRERYTYVMELEGNGYSYYIGHTSKSQEAIMKEHLLGGRSLTENNKPLKIIEWIRLELVDSSRAHEKSEQKIIEYMEQYGFSEVRGGTRYCFPNPDTHLNELKYAVANDETNKFDKIREQLEIYPDLKVFFEEWDEIESMNK